MITKQTPNGLVAIFVDETGREIATATDFKPDRPGGFTVIEAQRHRVREAIARKVIEEYASQRLTRAISQYNCAQIVEELILTHKCQIIIIPVGYTEEELS
jgi:hypothetical protein